MIADPTIHALIDLFKHLYRIKAIPYEWDTQNHVLRIPLRKKSLVIWYLNFVSSFIFTLGFLYRFCSHFVSGDFGLAEKVISFYLVAVQGFYSCMMLNSWIHWDYIPLFINQWLLFNKNSGKISVRKGGKAAIGSEVLQVTFTPVEVTERIVSVDDDRNNNDSSAVTGWKKLTQKINEREAVPKTLDFEGPAKKFNIYIMILKTFFTKTIKVKDLYEPPVLISVVKNSVLSDAIFFAILASRMDKMSLIPNKSIPFEIVSGVWLAYQVYMTWNNVIFYLFSILLFAYDKNKWLKFCENNQLWMMTSGALRRKFELNLRIHRILSILNNHYNSIYKAYITFGHKIFISSYQTAALFGTLRLWGKVNKFSFIVFPMTVIATTAAEILAYRIFAQNSIASHKFIKSWRWSNVLRAHQQRALRSCRPLKTNVWDLYTFERTTTFKFLYAVTLYATLFLIA